VLVSAAGSGTVVLTLTIVVVVAVVDRVAVTGCHGHTVKLAPVDERNPHVAVDRAPVAVVSDKKAIRIDGASARRVSALVKISRPRVAGLGGLGDGDESGDGGGDDGY